MPTFFRISWRDVSYASRLPANRVHPMRNVLICIAFAFGATSCASAVPQAQKVRVADEVEHLILDTMEQAGVPGMRVAIRRGDEIVFSGNYGYADLENQVPVADDTVFAIGSITKQVTGLAIAQLVEAGLVGLDDRVAKHLPQMEGLPVADLTIRQLLTHTAGLPNYTKIPALHDSAWKLHSHEDMLAWFINSPLEFTPGERWVYTNSGPYLLGMIIESVSGMSYAEYLDQNVIGPFGLQNTLYGDSKLVIPQRAKGYDRSPDGMWLNARSYDASVPYAAGALLSTSSDLLAYARAVLGGEGISRAIYDQITTPGELSDGTRIPYTLGAIFSTSFEGHRKFSHGGQIYGYSAELAYYPDDDLTIVILSNRQEYWPSSAGLERRIARAVLGIPQPAEAKVSAPASLIEAISGRYSMLPMTYFGLYDVRVWAEEQEVMISLEGGPAFPLRYVGSNRFVSEIDPEITLQVLAGQLWLNISNVQVTLRRTSESSDPVCERTKARLDQLRQQYEFPGAVMAIHSLDGRDCVFAVGLSDVEAGRAMQPTDRMLAASIGKTIVAAVTIHLAKDGVLDLDDPISKWIGDMEGFDRLPNSSEITIRHLLTHSSGLSDHIYNEKFLAEWRERFGTESYITPEEAVNVLYDTDPLFKPGDGFAYTDTGYILLGLAIERASGKPFYQLAETLFLDPFNLTRTAPANSNFLQGISQGYARQNQGRSDAPFTTLDENGKLRWNPLTEWTGGGFISNADDLARWALIHFSGASMNENYLDPMLDGIPAGARKAGSNYGLGVSSMMTPVGEIRGHTGWVPGYRSTAFFIPEHGTAYALQINTDIGLSGETDAFLQVNLALLDAMFSDAEVAH